MHTTAKIGNISLPLSCECRYTLKTFSFFLKYKLGTVLLSESTN